MLLLYLQTTCVIYQIKKWAQIGESISQFEPI